MGLGADDIDHLFIQMSITQKNGGGAKFVLCVKFRYMRSASMSFVWSFKLRLLTPAGCNSMTTVNIQEKGASQESIGKLSEDMQICEWRCLVHKKKVMMSNAIISLTAILGWAWGIWNGPNFASPIWWSDNVCRALKVLKVLSRKSTVEAFR